MANRKTKKVSWATKEKRKLKTKTRRFGESMSKAFAFIALIWLAFIANWVIYPVDFRNFGVVPRTFSGLPGVLLVPFLHSNFWHIFNNTLGLVVLLPALFVSHRFARAEQALLQLIVLSGFGLWCVGRAGTESHPVVHIGASGLVYALATYVLVTGFKHKNWLLMILSCVVMLQCGAGLLSGIVPSNGSVSWEGHLAGAISGVVVAGWTQKKELRTSLTQV